MIEELLTQSQIASCQLPSFSKEQIDQMLMKLASAIESEQESLLAANAVDLSLMDEDDPMYDRLKLTKDRLFEIASDMRHVATLPSPLGKILKENTLPNGLNIQKIVVPFGVIGVIYEARPNVSFDVAALCLKAGSACILKGGRDAQNSNECIVSLIQKVLVESGLPPHAVTLLPADRKATEELLHAREQVDLIIPRGSSGLINFVRENSKVPVIETGAGVVHCYIDKEADLQKAIDIIYNAKLRRVSVCNALDCAIVHAELLPHLARIMEPLAGGQTHIEADPRAYEALKEHYPAELLHHADTESYGHEFLSARMAVKTVDRLDEALLHIRHYSSKHSESIVSENKNTQEQFLSSVDAACVYANAPTSFTDGAQFGLGAEVGISTQKLHARGPMALEEICTYKWLIRGNGQIRP